MEPFTAQWIFEVLNQKRIELGLTQTEVTKRALGYDNADIFQKLRRGSVPSALRLKAACDALGLEFYIGPPRDEAGRSAAENAGKQVHEELERAVQRTEEFLDQLRQAKAAADDLTDPEALAGPKMPARILEFPASLTPDVLPVPLREEVRAAAGAGAIIDNEAVMGYVPFRRDWLVKHGIHNEKSSVIEVIGDSMEPNLQNRAWTLVDHQRVRRLRNSIFVLGTKDGVIVKRLAKEGGGWQLVSDNRNYKPLPCPQEATVIGQVMWVGRTL